MTIADYRDDGGLDREGSLAPGRPLLWRGGAAHRGSGGEASGATEEQMSNPLSISLPRAELMPELPEVPTE